MTSKEHAVLFSGAMVRAILSGAKAQTRRVIKEQPFERSWSRHDHRIHYMAGRASNGDEVDGLWAYSASSGGEWMAKCPFGQPGDRLWVRETTEADHDTSDGVALSRYSADGAPVCYPVGTGDGFDGAIQHWQYSRDARPSIHMPRDACRLVLEITGVRVERLQAISEADALAEGIKAAHGRFTHNAGLQECRTAAGAFEALWTSTGGDWGSNPWVWVIEFKRVEVAGG